MRKVITALIAIAMMASGTAYADTRQVCVMIDGQTYGALTDGAYIQDGYTMVSRDALSGVIRTGVQVSDGDTSMVVGGGECKIVCAFVRTRHGRYNNHIGGHEHGTVEQRAT